MDIGSVSSMSKKEAILNTKRNELMSLKQNALTMAKMVAGKITKQPQVDGGDVVCIQLPNKMLI